MILDDFENIQYTTVHGTRGRQVPTKWALSVPHRCRG